MRGTGVLRALLAFVSALGLLLAAHPAPAQEGVKVESIVFDGNDRYSSEHLKLYMRTKEGKPLDRELLVRDMAALRAYFEDISFEEIPVPGGVRLVFHVLENPLVSRVEFLGLKAFLEADLRPLIETKTGYPLAAFRLENDVRVLKRKYRDEGYHFVEVTPQFHDDEGARRVVFRVEEGPEVGVGAVLFEGNESITDSRLRAVMALRPSKFPSLFYPSTAFVERRLEEDRVAIAKLYRDEGFLEAKVWVRGFEFDEDREEATITFVIEEGGPWTVGEIQVVGGAGLADRERIVSEASRLQPGQLWLKKDVDRVVREMEAEAKRQGFADARVAVEPIPREEGRVQDVRFVVREGKRFTVRFVDVEGNVLTKDRVILREFTVAPGDALDSNAVAKAVRRVMDTQYFTSAVPFYPEVKDEPDRKDVLIQVEENPRTSQFKIGAGISSDTGFFGMLSVSFRNFDIWDWRVGSFFRDFGDGRALKGAGQTLIVTLQPGSEVSSYRLAFTEPSFYDRPVAVGFDLYANESTLFAYEQDRTGVEFSVDRRWILPGEDLDDRVTVGLSPKIEHLVISHIDEDEAPPNAYYIEGGNTIHSLSLDLMWRRIDQEYATERGWRLRTKTEYGGNVLGGDFEFLKNEAEAIRVFTVYRDADERAHTLKFRAGLGLAMSLDRDPLEPGAPRDSRDVPLPERFMAGGTGGIGAVRGYRYAGMGPHGEGNPYTDPAGVRDSIASNKGEPMGGDALLVGSMEYNVPLFADVLRGAAFVDAGNLQMNTGRLFQDWRASAGFGLLIKVPFFGEVPLRFDFAWPIHSQDGDDAQVLSFDISKYF